MRVTLFHPIFGEVGGAEVLVTRHVALLRAAGLDVRVVTRTFHRHRWQAWADAERVAVRVMPRRWLERRLYRTPARRLQAAADRLAPHLAGSPCVVAYNAPCPAVVGTLRQPPAHTVWHCNEPPRALHLRETMRTAVARTEATAAHRILNATTDPLDLAWMAGKLAEHDRRRAADVEFALDCALDVERVGRLGRIVALSAYSSESVRLIYGRTTDAVVPPVIPAPAHVPRRGGIDRAGGGLHVLAHSRLEPMKNIDTVLRGFAHFCGRVGGRHVLHVVGTGALDAPLRRVAEALGLPTEAVRWHGFLDDGALADVYARCDVFALLPLDEPFGMVFPEAALRGLLLIGSDHGGPAEILDGGAFGWAVDAFDPEALAAALAAAWALPDDEAIRRRDRAAVACHARYGAATVGPQLRAALLD